MSRTTTLPAITDVEHSFDGPNGPTVTYPDGLDADEVELDNPLGWRPDWETPAVRLADGRCRAPLVLVEPQVVSVSPSDYGVAGWDVDLDVGDRPVGVTLVRRRYDWRPARWGSVDNWIDSGTVSQLWSELPAEAREAVIDAIEYAAVIAILESDVEPSEAE